MANVYIINSADEIKLPWLKFAPSPLPPPPSPLEQRTINFILRILNMKWSERQPQIYKQLFYIAKIDSFMLKQLRQNRYIF